MLSTIGLDEARPTKLKVNILLVDSNTVTTAVCITPNTVCHCCPNTHTSLCAQHTSHTRVTYTPPSTLF